MGDYNAIPNPDIPRIRKFAFGLNFAPQDDLKVDEWLLRGRRSVYSVNRRIGSTRLKVLVDRNIFLP